MQFFVNHTSGRVHPIEYVRTMEEAGFDGVTCADHYWLAGVASYHVWATLGAMAAVTERVTLSPGYANNLFRSPVEFAQASVSMQRLSGGRYEAALGAGWQEQEILATGQAYPAGRVRARMYREALLITRALFSTGSCSFEGEYYTIDVPHFAEFIPETPIPLVASVGGPWTIRHITPIVDRVELKFGRTTRQGSFDAAALASVDDAELRQMVAEVREVRPDIDVGLFVMIAVGDDAAVAPVKESFGEGLYGRFAGEASKVRDNLLALEEMGIDRVHLADRLPGSVLRLCEALC
jgi:alkanesulfonate monooxygenase SsuD/methylene tetrahydromethanopterin reductase-like flavin-dependent oxidoreductase (luciferase family)